MASPRLLLLLSVLALLWLFSEAQIDDGTCGAEKPPEASEDCQHGADCRNGTCYCPPGFAHGYTCGFSYDNCMCMECTHGYMFNEGPPMTIPHYCVCDPGWTGRNCDICTTDQVCKDMFPDSLDAGCDNTQVVSKEKIYNCNITDPFFTSLFPQSEIRFQIYREGLNVTEGKLNFQAFAIGTDVYLIEMFYCLLDRCTETGSEDRTTYKCLDTRCAITGASYVHPTAKRLIEEAEGMAYVECTKPIDGILDCLIYVDAFKTLFGEIPSVCVAGECYNVPRPIINEPFNPTPVIVVGTISGSAVIVVLVSMYLYRKRQQRYFAFSAKKAFGSFIDLKEVISFGNDTLYWDHVNYVLHGKQILFDVSGCAKPGEVLALIGASGAGKTTLLDILAQRTKIGTVTGVITLNGEPLGPTFLRITSYVDQEPAAIGTQTVRELLMTAANLRLPEIVSVDAKKARIAALVSDLGIDHILDRRYGEQGKRGISGGEKRRVQIACQLVTGPSVVFLDEPTSGLDSYNALSVCKFLKVYASKKNRTVIMSIHQPRSDIYHTFDKLMVLAGGRTIYFGPTGQAKIHFHDIGYPCPPDFNPADHILDISMAQKDSPEALETAFRSTPLHTELVTFITENSSTSLPPVSSSGYGSIATNTQYRKIQESDLPDGYSDRYATSFWTQVSVLSGRAFSDMYRYPLLLWLHLAFGVLSGVLIGFFFFDLDTDFAGTQNRIGMLLFLLIVLAFASMSSIGFMGREREVFTQERAAGAYKPLSYFVVKVIFDLLPLRILPCLILSSIVYVMSGLKLNWTNYGTYLGVLLLFCTTTTLLCISIATLTRNVSLANLISIITLLFFMLFQGAMINLPSLPMYLAWMTYLSPFRFALNSLLVNELDGLNIWFDPVPELEPEWISGRLVLTMFGFDVDSAYTTDIIALGAMVVGWFVIGLISLILLVKEKR